jgi:glyoxylase-like metal-dependent hydrolase (beta-lactamase superfamily II)
MLTVKAFTFNPAQENTYVLYNERNKAIIIDPGCYFSAEQEKLKKFIEDTELVPVRLLNTHCHLDHVFGNLWVAGTWGLQPHIHTNELPVLAAAPASGEKWGMPFKNYEGPLQYLEAGDSILLGDDVLKVLLAPGHSPGSICFYCEQQEFLIGGDVLFRESIGRTDLAGGDYDTLLYSIRTQLLTLPDNTTVYPGHGVATTIGYEKRNNPFLQDRG